jgi:hypothetical protein
MLDFIVKNKNFGVFKHIGYANNPKFNQKN